MRYGRAQVETASQSVDMVKELQSTERFSPQQAQEAMAKADRLYGEGSAMAEAAKAALERLNQLARDPKTVGGMRENRAALRQADLHLAQHPDDLFWRVSPRPFEAPARSETP